MQKNYIKQKYAVLYFNTVLLCFQSPMNSSFGRKKIESNTQIVFFILRNGNGCRKRIFRKCEYLQTAIFLFFVQKPF